MDNSDEVSEFLTTRRARISPQQAGLPVFGSGTRRVPGLRREEVALVAGVSVDYYTRIERGDLSGVSDTVLDAIARALQFDDAERAHLHDLAKAASGATRRRSPRRQQEVRPALQHILDGMTDVPAFVRNGRLDVLATNRLARALYAPAYAAAPDNGPVNLARFCMLDPQARSLYPDWDGAADTTVALLRTEAGRAPHDKRLSAVRSCSLAVTVTAGTFSRGRSHTTSPVSNSSCVAFTVQVPLPAYRCELRQPAFSLVEGHLCANRPSLRISQPARSGSGSHTTGTNLRGSRQRLCVQRSAVW